jgi:hypothetical protein
MTWLVGLLTGLPGFLNGVLAYLNKKQDTALEQFRIGNTNGRDVSIAVVQAEIARQNTVASVLTVAMSHPVWWVAWGLGVFPVMTYYACIFWVSTFPFWGWTVLKAPADALEFAKLVTGSMFGIAGVSSVVAGVAHAWQKRA